MAMIAPAIMVAGRGRARRSSLGLERLSKPSDRRLVLAGSHRELLHFSQVPSNCGHI
jgi:hypothetical protein